MRPELSQYNHVSAGKVREIYKIDDDTLLMVVSDRISAYDHILDPEIPDKGRVLTAMAPGGREHDGGLGQAHG